VNSSNISLKKTTIIPQSDYTNQGDQHGQDVFNPYNSLQFNDFTPNQNRSQVPFNNNNNNNNQGGFPQFGDLNNNNTLKSQSNIQGPNNNLKFPK